MSDTKKVAKNTVVQIIGRLLGMAVMLGTVMYVANHLLVDGSLLTGFGQYTIVFAYIAILGVAGDFGLYAFLVREAAEADQEESGKLIGAALGMRFQLMVLAFGIVGLLMLLAPYPSSVKIGILLGVPVAFSILFGQTVAAVFQAKLIPDRIVIAETFGRLTILSLVILFLRSGSGLISVVTAHLIGYLVTFALMLIMARPYSRIRFNVRLSYWAAHLPELWPIGVVTILSLIHFKIDSLILSFFKPASEVGIYGISYKLLELVLVLPTIVATNILPLLSAAWGKNSLDEVRRLFRLSASVLMAVAVLAFILVEVLAPWLVVFIAQPQFIAATVPLRILMGAVLAAYFGDLLVQTLIAGRMQRLAIAPHIVAVVANVVLNLIAIPKYSYIGAAYTTATTEFILIVYLFIVNRNAAQVAFPWLGAIRLVPAVTITAVIALISRNAFLPDIVRFGELGKLSQGGYLGFVTLCVIAVFILVWRMPAMRKASQT